MSNNKMRKSLFVFYVIILVAVGSISGCTRPDLRGRLQPIDQVFSRWESDDSRISFVVDETHHCVGTITYDKEILDVVFVFGLGKMEIYPIEEYGKGYWDHDKVIEKWKIKIYSEEKFLAEVYKSTYFTEGEKIVFYRVGEIESNGTTNH